MPTFSPQPMMTETPTFASTGTRSQPPPPPHPITPPLWTSPPSSPTITFRPPPPPFPITPPLGITPTTRPLINFRPPPPVHPPPPPFTSFMIPTGRPPMPTGTHDPHFTEPPTTSTGGGGERTPTATQGQPRTPTGDPLHSPTPQDFVSETPAAPVLPAGPVGKF